MFLRQYCSIPELPTPSSPSFSSSKLICTCRFCLSSYLLFLRFPRQILQPLFQMCKSISRVFPSQQPWLSCPFPDIDVILGMGWLVQYKANIDCPSRSVRLKHDSGAEILYTCGSMAGAAQLYALNA